MPALRLVGLAVALVLLGACSDDDPSIVGSPPSGATAPTSATSGTSPSAAPTSTLPPGVDQLVAVTVRDAEVVGGAQRVRVEQGSVVRLVVTSDVSDEIHLHTYDKSVDVKAGGRASLTFTASIPGVITAELESRHLVLVRLQVQ